MALLGLHCSLIGTHTPLLKASCSFPSLLLPDFLTILAQHFQSHLSIPQATGRVTLSTRFSQPTWNWVRSMGHLVWISRGSCLHGSAPL